MQQQGSSDRSLIEAIVRHDESALKALYDRYGALVFTLALRRLGDRGLAEEVLQDVFLRCWEQARTYRPEAGGVSAWLFGITRNRAIDVRRSRQQQARRREEEYPADPSMLKDGAQHDASELVALRVTLQAALRALSPAQREAIDLAYYGDLSQSEIAKRLGEPLGTVKTRIRAGLERLRRTLQPGLQPDLETTSGADVAP